MGSGEWRDPGSSSLVCQALVEEEEGWLPSPPLAEVQVQVQEEGEEGSQYESRRLSIPTFPLALL